MCESKNIVETLVAEGRRRKSLDHHMIAYMVNNTDAKENSRKQISYVVEIGNVLETLGT